MARKKLNLKGLSTEELLERLDEIGIEVDDDKIEEQPQKQSKPKLPQLPKRGGKSPLLKKKTLEFEDGTIRLDNGDEITQEEFEEFCTKFTANKAKFNALKKEVDEGRSTILEIMDDNVKFEGEQCKVSITSMTNNSINAPLVVETLLEQDPQQLIELAKLGILQVNKTSFDKWLKTAGLDAAPFTIKGRPKQKLVVRRKQRD